MLHGRILKIGDGDYIKLDNFHIVRLSDLANDVTKKIDNLKKITKWTSGRVNKLGDIR